MREILFRGKRLDTGEWLKGQLARYNPELEVANIVDQHEFLVPVITSTVSQFTGMYDKNGKRIFEGDILEIENEGAYLCVWDDGNLEFALTNRRESFGMAYVPTYDVIVVGNIQDSPEPFSFEDNE